VNYTKVQKPKLPSPDDIKKSITRPIKRLPVLPMKKKQKMLFLRNKKKNIRRFCKRKKSRIGKLLAQKSTNLKGIIMYFLFYFCAYASSSFYFFPYLKVKKKNKLLLLKNHDLAGKYKGYV